MEKPILQMVGGEKYIRPHYDTKSENTGCYISSEGFTGIEFNGVRFSNISEMLHYMDMQRTQIIEAKEIIKDLLKCLPKENIEDIYEATESAEEFLRRG